MSRYRSSGSTMSVGFALFMLGVFILGAIGWVLNIVHLIGKTPLVFDGETIVQIIGIFIAPLGAVLGWIL